MVPLMQITPWHTRHIMAKTNTTTRTGILVRVFHM